MSVVCLAILNAHVLGYFPFDTGGLVDNSSPAMRVGADALMIVLASMLLFSYGVALFSDYSARATTPPPSRRAGPAASLDGDGKVDGDGEGDAGRVGLGRSGGPE